jgi:hypothetical protein
MAPALARKVVHGVVVPRTAGPNRAPRMSCARVPTMISVSAGDTRNQIAQRVATTAKPNQRAAKPQTSVIKNSYSRVVPGRSHQPLRRLRGTPSPVIATFLQESNEGKGRKVSPKPARTKVVQIILAPFGKNKTALRGSRAIVALPHSVVERRPFLHCVRRPGSNLRAYPQAQHHDHPAR